MFSHKKVILNFQTVSIYIIHFIYMVLNKYLPSVNTFTHFRGLGGVDKQEQQKNINQRKKIQTFKEKFIK